MKIHSGLIRGPNCIAKFLTGASVFGPITQQSIKNLIFLALFTSLLSTFGLAQTAKISVLFPPAGSNSQYYNDVQTYLVSNNPAVYSAVFPISWSTIDSGNGVYNFSSIDNEIVPWVNAGKKVNFVLWGVSQSASGSSGSNRATPGYIWSGLGTSNYTTCNGEKIPNYRSTYFQSKYQAAIKAVYQHYANNPTIGYVRVGLGSGGETHPAYQWNDLSTQCGLDFQRWGTTITSWEAYLNTMLKYESSLGKELQFMVGIVPMGSPNTTVAAYVASVATPLGIGFGSQGLQSADINNCSKAAADWCTLFSKYKGVPLELQTVKQSCPAGKGCSGLQASTGSLVPLLPWAVQNKAQYLEIYYADWLVGFDPKYPGYSQYGAGYAKALNTTAGVKTK